MIGLEEPPSVRNSPEKLPASPAFLICIHTVSPPPVLSSPPSYLPTSLLSFTLLPYLSSFPSLSLCVSFIILHCSTCTVVQHLQSELCTQAHTLTNTHTEGDTRPPLPAAPLLLSHLSAGDTKQSTTPGVPVLHRETLLALHQNSILN